MRIGVKYCGGCNPRYNRTEFAARLKKELDGRSVEWVSAGAAEEPLDFVLVICGCTAACAQHQDLNGAYGKLVVHTPAQYAAVREQLAHFMK